jgi:hypothetical protein
MMHFSTVFTGTKFRSRSALLPSTSPADRPTDSHVQEKGWWWWSPHAGSNGRTVPQLNMRPTGARYVSESRVLDWNLGIPIPSRVSRINVRIHAPTTTRAPAGFARLASAGPGPSLLSHTHTLRRAQAHMLIDNWPGPITRPKHVYGP